MPHVRGEPRGGLGPLQQQREGAEQVVLKRGARGLPASPPLRSCPVACHRREVVGAQRHPHAVHHLGQPRRLGRRDGDWRRLVERHRHEADHPLRHPPPRHRREQPPHGRRDALGFRRLLLKASRQEARSPAPMVHECVVQQLGGAGGRDGVAERKPLLRRQPFHVLGHEPVPHLDATRALSDRSHIAPPQRALRVWRRGNRARSARRSVISLAPPIAV
jgi:hypothetical protein